MPAVCRPPAVGDLGRTSLANLIRPSRHMLGVMGTTLFSRCCRAAPFPAAPKLAQTSQTPQATSPAAARFTVFGVCNLRLTMSPVSHTEGIAAALGVTAELDMSALWRSAQTTLTIGQGLARHGRCSTSINKGGFLIEVGQHCTSLTTDANGLYPNVWLSAHIPRPKVSMPAHMGEIYHA